MESNPRRHTSYFFPLLLIALGVIWLLNNLGIILAINFTNLLMLWPLLLVVLGLELIFGRRYPWVSFVIAAIAVGAIVWSLVGGPSFASRDQGVKHQVFSALTENSESVDLYLDLGSASTTVFAGINPKLVLDADLDYIGEIRIDDNQARQRVIRLDEFSPANTWVFGSNLFETRHWKIGLNPKLPLTLDTNVGSGSTDLDLSVLNLSALKVDGGSGSFNVVLPEKSKAYTVDIAGGSGSIQVDIPCKANVTLHLDGGSGSQTISFPQGCPARVEIQDSGSGSINLGSGFKQIRTENDQKGVWERGGYSTATGAITIIVEGHGSGSLNIQ